MKWLRFDGGRIDNGLHLGASVDLHRHGLTYSGGIAGRARPLDDYELCPIHFHVEVEVLYWWANITLGREDPDE
jgi:hypothetical protein